MRSLRQAAFLPFSQGQPVSQEESLAVNDYTRTVLAGSLLALAALGILLPAAADATLVPRTVFAEEFGRHG
jgi:hypothetical protein